MAKGNKISRRNFIEAVAALGAVGLSACAANSPQSARLSTSERGSGKLPSRGEFVVRNAYVVTMDNKLGDIPNGDVHVRNGALVAVGPKLNAPGRRRNRRPQSALLYRVSSTPTFIFGVASLAASSPTVISIISR